MNGIMNQTKMHGYATYDMGCCERSPENDPLPKDLMGKCSRFGMVSMALTLLMCAGIILYAILTV